MARTRTEGVGAAVHAACGKHGQTFDQLAKALDYPPETIRRAIGNLTYTNKIAGDRRTGFPTVYRAVEGTSVADLSGRPRQARVNAARPTKVEPPKPEKEAAMPAALSQAYEVTLAPTESIGGLAPSIGTMIPLNRANGRIEDLIAAVLDPKIPRTVNEVLEAIPAGWSKTDVVAAMADGVIDNWVRASRDSTGARSAFVRVGEPPAPVADPLVERFRLGKLAERCQLLDQDLADALRAARDLDAPAELIRSMVDLRHCAQRLMRQTSA